LPHKFREITYLKDNGLAFVSELTRVRRMYQSNGFGVRGQSSVCLRLGRHLSSVPAQAGPVGEGAYLVVGVEDIFAEIRKLVVQN
jgi:hypothetical protein